RPFSAARLSVVTPRAVRLDPPEKRTLPPVASRTSLRVKLASLLGIGVAISLFPQRDAPPRPRERQVDHQKEECFSRSAGSLRDPFRQSARQLRRAPPAPLQR